MRHPINYRGGVRSHGRRGEGVLVFLMPSLGSPNIGVFEDNKGAIDLAKNPLSASNSKSTSMYGTIFCASWWGRETCRLNISGRTTSMRTFPLIGKESFENHRDFLLGIQ